MSISALYFHIPFCETICPFCAFAVSKNSPRQRHREYLDALLTEVERICSLYSDSICSISSVYIGGGTPSLLAEEEVDYLLTNITKHFTFLPNVEIAFELNPENVNHHYLQHLLAVGINRFSIGIQSTDELMLQHLGRNHNAQQSINALETIASYELNWNADLLFGHSSQSLATLHNDLQTILSYQPTHFSLYCLEIVPQSKFYFDQNLQNWTSDHQEDLQKYYSFAVEYLQSHGWNQYEISNFSKPQFEGSMNLQVWSGREYLGFGTGAHSYVDHQRWSNERGVRRYITKLRERELPQTFREDLSLTQQANECLLLALRTTQGLNIEEWEDRFQQKWSKQQWEFFAHLEEQEYVIYQAPYLQLTTKGLFVADAITAQVFLD